MRTLAAIGSTALAVLLLAPAGASAATRLKLPAEVVSLAADGPRVAIAVAHDRNRCDAVVVWSTRTGGKTRFDATTNCGGGSDVSGGNGLLQVAIAGKQVAWLETAAGNLRDLVLYTRALGQRKAVEVAFAENHSGADEQPDGDWLGHLLGDGDLLVYNAWSECTSVPPTYEWGSPKCDEPGTEEEPVTLVEDPRLLRVGSSAPIASGAPSYAAAALGDGMIATVHEDGSVSVLVADGTVVAAVSFPPGELHGVALIGSELLALRGARLERYALPSGSLVGTIALPSAQQLVDAEDGLAVLLAGRAVLVIRLADGKVGRFTAGRGLVGATLEAPGLAYARNAGGKGRVVFVPALELERRLG